MGAAGLTSSSFEMAGARRHRHRARPRPGAAARDRHDAVRDHALRDPGADAHGRSSDGPRGRGARASSRKWEPRRRRDRPRHRHRPHACSAATARSSADMPVAPLTDAPPVYDRPRGRAAGRAPRRPATRRAARRRSASALLRLLGSPDLASKRWICQQYDHTVQADTVAAARAATPRCVRVNGTAAGPGADDRLQRRATAAPIPYAAARRRWPRPARNLACVGAEPLAVTDCLNFGNPERPEVMGQFAEAIEGIAEACRALDCRSSPATSRSTTRPTAQAILPTPDGRRPRPDRRPRPHGGYRLPAEPGLSPGPARRDAGLARRSLYLRAILSAARTGRRRRSIWPPSAAHGEFVLRLIARRRGPRLPRPRRRRPRRWRWPRCAWPAASAPRSTCRRESPAARAGCSARTRRRYLLAVRPEATAPSCWRRGRRRACWPARSARTGGDALIARRAKPPISVGTSCEAAQRGLAARATWTARPGRDGRTARACR